MVRAVAFVIAVGGVLAACRTPVPPARTQREPAPSLPGKAERTDPTPPEPIELSTPDAWTQLAKQPEVGTLEMLPPMHEPRSGHSSVLLKDGRVLAVGGFGHMKISDVAELWDPKTSSWSFAASMHVARELATATVLKDGRVLVAGGFIPGGTQPEPTASTEIWDPKTNKWRDGPKMATPRAWHTATMLRDGRVAFIGGQQASVGATLASIEVLDARAKAFSPGGSMRRGRFMHAAALLPDDRILVVGGRQDYRLGTASAEIWTERTGASKESEWAAVPREFVVALSLPGGFVLVTGSAESPSAEIWDDQHQGWCRVGALEGDSDDSLVLLDDGRVLLVGQGRGHIALWNPSTDAWSGAGTMADRTGASVTHLLDGRVLIAGGRIGGDSFLGDTVVWSPRAKATNVAHVGMSCTPRAQLPAPAFDESRIHPGKDVAHQIAAQFTACNVDSDCETLNGHRGSSDEDVCGLTINRHFAREFDAAMDAAAAKHGIIEDNGFEALDGCGWAEAETHCVAGQCVFR